MKPDTHEGSESITEVTVERLSQGWEWTASEGREDTGYVHDKGQGRHIWKEQVDHRGRWWSSWKEVENIVICIDSFTRYQS